MRIAHGAGRIGGGLGAALLALWLACIVTPVWAAAACGPSQLGSPCGEGGPATLAEAGAGVGAGNPVHLATGNKHQREVDLPVLPGTLGLELVRLYNAQDPRQGMFGPAWGSSYDTRVYRIGARVQVVQADGSRIDFTATDVAGPCTPAGPAQGVFEILPSAGYRWRWPGGHELAFDPAGRLVGIVAPDGAQLRLVRGQVPGQPAYGRLVRVLDPQGRALVFDYDDSGRVVRAHTPAGRIAYHYDTAGRLARADYPDGHARAYDYDLAQQALGRTALAQISVVRPGEVTRRVLGRWAYDAAGRVVLAELPGLADGRGRLAFEYAPPGEDASRTVQVRDAAGRSTRFVLAADQGRYRLVSAEGDGCAGCPPPGLAAGRIAAALALAANTEGDADQGWQRPSVVPGQVARLQMGWSSHTAPHGPVRLPARVRETGWRMQQGEPQAIERQWALQWAWRQGQYRLADVQRVPAGLAAAGWRPGREPADPDWPGLRVQRDDFGAVLRWASEVTGEQRWRYGGQGELLARHYANGDAWHYTYDARGRLVQARAGQTRVQLGWHEGQVTEILHPAEREQRRHDARGQLLERRLQRPADGSRLDLHEAYAYDAQGRVVQHHLPEGGTLHYRWGEGQQLLGLSWTDAAGRHHDILRAAPASGGYQYGNRVVMRAWLQGARLGGLAYARGAVARPHTLLWAQALAYDGQGRIRQEQLRGALAGPQQWHYTHDARGRLATAVSAAGQQGFDWHDDGSRKGQVAGAIVRDASGLPQQVDGLDLGYSTQRRLATVARAGRVLARYAHNASGERIAAWFGEDAVPLDYLHDGPALAAVWHRGQVQRRYVYAQGVPVAMLDYRTDALSPRLYFIHADAIGLPRLITDTHGRPRWQGDYSPLGELLAQAGDPALAPALRLPGQVADPVTGWHDNYQRTYDPRRGHYLEPDPLGPASLHAHLLPEGVRTLTSPFGYAVQQPRRHADPAGLLLLAFDGTLSGAQRGGNVYQFALLYRGDDAADELAVGYEPGPGEPERLIDLDALLAQSAGRILDAQWARLIARLQQATPDAQPTPIDLVGYSRGASLARHFANQLAGLVREGRFWQWQAGIGAVTGCVELRFMGLFDSVAQFGLLGRDNEQFDFTVAPVWAAVAHAVALHEHRQLFPLHSLADARGQLPANAVELPFVGAHADIGGGLAQRDGRVMEQADLSDLALHWMLAQAQAAGVTMDAPLPAQAEVSSPLLHDMRSADERATEALRNRWESLQSDMAGVFRPGLLHYDRAVFAADGSQLATTQHAHAEFGMHQRRLTEAFIRRVEGWLGVTGQVAGTVDLAAYQAWLAAREGGWP